jgi:hypothetical protein
VQVCVVLSQYPFVGQTRESLQAAPIDTGDVQTKVVALVEVKPQTRLSAHTLPSGLLGSQGWLSAIAGTQLPHCSIDVAEHRPLAHCQGLLQPPPFGTVPPLTRQAVGTPPSPRNVVQSMPVYVLPHCSALDAVQPECGTVSESLQDPS